MKPEVSVIIPCYNEERFIGPLIEGLLEQDMPREAFELIFVDGMSKDRTPEIIEGYAEQDDRVRYLENEKRYVPHAMNLGIEAARGDIIVRLDAHGYYPRNYLSYLVRNLKESGADNVGVPWDTRTPSSTSKSKAVQKVLTHPLGVGNAHFRLGIDEAQEVDTVPFGCYWKSTLQRIGGYNLHLKRNQDIELNKRLLRQGGRILLLPAIRGIYYARDRYSALAWNNFQNGLWNIRTVYITKEFASLSLRHFVPLGFVLSLLLPLLLSPLFPFLLIIPAGVLFVYLLAIFSASVRMNDRETSLFHMMLAFLILHFSYGTGSLIGLFRLDDLFKESKGANLDRAHAQNATDGS